MVHIIVLAAVLSFVLVGPATAQQQARPDDVRHGVRHSGRIVEVAHDGSAIVLEELITWSGPGTGVVTRSIQLTPRTSIRLVERSATVEGDRTAIPGWNVTVMDAAQLRPGDFVTVMTDDDHRAVAVALQIVRPGTE